MILDLTGRACPSRPSPVSSASIARRCASTSPAAWSRPSTARASPARGGSTPFTAYLRERVQRLPGPDRPAAVARAQGARLQGRLYRHHATSCATAPAEPAAFEVRFETPPGDQAQVDFAQFQVVFADEPGADRIVWLFSMVLGYSPADLGALRPPPGPADGAALPHRRLRGDRRRAARDPL